MPYWNFLTCLWVSLLWLVCCVFFMHIRNKGDKNKIQKSNKSKSLNINHKPNIINCQHNSRGCWKSSLVLKQVKLTRPIMVEPVESLKLNVGKVWLLSGLLGLTVWLIPLLLGKYVDVTFPYISREDIFLELVGTAAGDKGNKIELCPAISPHLQTSPHLMSNDVEALAEEVVARDNQVQPGGIWKPKECKARYQVRLAWLHLDCAMEAVLVLVLLFCVIDAPQ